MEELSFVSYFLVRKAPVLLLAFGGIAFAIIRWKRHPKVSLITIVALIFYLLESFIYWTVLYQLPRLFARQMVPYETYDIYYTVLFVLDDIAYAIVIVLLVIAAFLQRKVQTTT